MAMFGRSYRRGLVDPNLANGNTLPDMRRPEKMGGMDAVRSGRGLIGAGWRKNLPNILQTVGAGLQQMDGGSELTDHLAAQQQMQRQQEEDARLMDERKQAAGQRAELEALIATLPPDQQRLARLDPEGFVRGLMRQQGGDWQNNGTVPYRIDPTTGAVITGSGTIPHRPRQPLIQYGAAGDEADWEYGE